jgi:glycosyltransferase involved in cell wall biosynthesis
VVRIASGLAERGHAVRVLFRDPPASLRARLRQAYLRARFKQRNDWLRSFPGEVTPYRELTAGVVGRNEILVGVGVSCVLEISVLPDHCGIKVHNSRGVEPWIPEALARAWRLSMPRIVVGSHLVGLMRDAGSHDAIYVAHNGLDRSAYFPCVPAKLRQGVGAVYHGGGVKDPAMMLEVFRRLAEIRPGVPLYSFGSYPRPRGMPRAVRYVRLPALPQARDIYSRCLVWFLTSRNEGLPNPVLESMACGCAPVSTDCGGARDIIENGRSGLLVPAGDTDAMLGAILGLLDDARRRQRIVEAGERVLERFTWPQAVASFESALNDIFEHSGPARHRPAMALASSHAA